MGHPPPTQNTLGAGGSWVSGGEWLEQLWLEQLWLEAELLEAGMLRIWEAVDTGLIPSVVPQGSALVGAGA